MIPAQVNPFGRPSILPMTAICRASLRVPGPVRRCAAGRSYSQFSTERPGTFEKWRVLFVTRVHLSATA